MQAMELGLQLQKASRTPLIGLWDTTPSHFFCQMITVPRFVPQLETDDVSLPLALRYPEMNNLHIVPGKKTTPNQCLIRI